MFRWGRKRNSDSAESLCSAELAVFDRLEKMSDGEEYDDETWVTFQVPKSPSDGDVQPGVETTGRTDMRCLFQENRISIGISSSGF